MLTNKFHIWSNEHNAWWKPNHAGYTNRVEDAGVYSYDESITICKGANYGWDMDNIRKLPNELPIEINIAGRLL